MSNINKVKMKCVLLTLIFQSLLGRLNFHGERIISEGCGWWVVFILNVWLWGSDSKWRHWDLKINKNLRQAGSWSEQLLVLTPSSGPGSPQVNTAKAGPVSETGTWLTHWLTDWWNIFTSSNHKFKNRN